MRTRFSRGIVLIPILAFALSLGAGFGESYAQDGPEKGKKDWCRTYEAFAAKYPAMLMSRDGVCPTQGDCDIAANRDAMIPDATTPILWIRLKFHVFREDDGTNPAASQADVDQQVAVLNTVYLPYRVQFIYDTDFINNSEYRSMSDAEMDPMKTDYAEAPGTQCNIYVTWVVDEYSQGTFAWAPDALTATGGVVMHEAHFGPGQDVLAHEIGHNLGLWHTFHGVSESPDPYPDCDWGCYEHTNSNSDDTGDFCSDTPPTPKDYNCFPNTGTDACTDDDPWGTTWPENYMSYGGPGCWDEFSVQQSGRMHCWINAELTAWLSQLPPVAICTDVTVAADENCEAVTASIDAGSYDPEGGPITLTQNPPGPYPLGETPCVLTVTDDDGLTDECNAVVTVVDITPPVPVCPSNITVANDPDECSAVVDFTIDATDNCPGYIVEATPPSGSAFPVGTTEVSVVATDASGNTATCVFEVAVSDTQKPVVTCPEDITVWFSNPGEAVVEYQATATDNCDDDPTVWCEPPSGSTFPIGENTVNCHALDDAGNQDDCFFSFHLAYIDIKPRSCPNALNVKPYTNDAERLMKVGGGDPISDVEEDLDPLAPPSVLPVAILGSDELDVRDIEVETILLEGIAPLRHSYDDVAGPAEDEDGYCACTTAGHDGYSDLMLHFSRQEIIAAIGPVSDGDVVQLILTGRLSDGTPLFGGDCVLIRGPHVYSEPDYIVEEHPSVTLVGANPNPFNPVTKLSFTLSQSADYSITILNIAGQVVQEFKGEGQPGLNTVIWDASDKASGMYFYRLSALGQTYTKKMVLMK